jgi:hypothetical protein
MPFGPLRDAVLRISVRRRPGIANAVVMQPGGDATNGIPSAGQ